MMVSETLTSEVQKIFEIHFGKADLLFVHRDELI